MAKARKKRRIYVLDTSVILHDHSALFCFEEHDVVIPITVLEELDNFKRGNEIKNFEAREFIRAVDKLAADQNLQDWIPLSEGLGSFRIAMNGVKPKVDAIKTFAEAKADHKILNIALSIQEKEPNREVVLVTKDINLRLKAKALDLASEDYETGKVQDVRNLYTGKKKLDNVDGQAINTLYKDGFIEDFNIVDGERINNHFYILRNGKSSSLACTSHEANQLRRVDRRYAFGIKPRNAEQTFALHAILDEDIKLVTLQGVAGTGKTLLALAGSLEQHKRYRQIILARPIIPLSNRDIGYLPGDIKDKIGPYMEPLWDNLSFIKNQFSANEKKNKIIDQMVKDEKVVIAPLAYIRGRSLSEVIFIVDEAQNLTPHEVKTIITRAGEGTKIIFTGDVYQIDTPYLDEQSNGLSYLIDRLKGDALFAHITLEKGERSELANLANECL